MDGAQHGDSAFEEGRLGEGAPDRPERSLRDGVLGARDRAHAGGRSRQRTLLVSARTPSLSKGARCKRRNRRAREDDEAAGGERESGEQRQRPGLTRRPRFPARTEILRWAPLGRDAQALRTCNEAERAK